MTLGMADFDEAVDEDYIVVGRARNGRSSAIDGIARRPTAWVARHLRRRGGELHKRVSDPKRDKIDQFSMDLLVR